MRQRVIKLVKAVGLVSLALVLVGAALVAWWWRGSIPAREGQVRLAGLTAPVRVGFDARGVPQIEAASLDDAVVVQGYLHGLQRPMQVELRRRATSGQLAALAGPSLAAADEDALRQGFHAAAAADETHLSAGPRRLAEAYVRGLNAGLAAAARRPSPAMRVARVTPQPWTVRDVLGFGRRFVSDLSSAEYYERARLGLLAKFGPEDLATLWEAAFGEPFPPLHEEIRRLVGQAPPSAVAATIEPLERFGRGSNAWAVARARSATGGALLAGDPHLDYELPSLWYDIVLRWPGGSLAGASLAGAPGVVIGHSENLAWSFTTAGFDDADLFVVEVDDEARPARFRENGSFRPFEIEKHALAIRGEDPRTVTVARTGTAVYAGPSGFPGRGLLFRSTSRESSGLFDALAGLGAARSLEEAIDAARRFPGPGQNLLLAARDGRIAHVVVGAWPERAAAGWDGRNPAPWAGAGSWVRLRPPEAMPVVVDPPEGFVFSANEGGLAVRFGVTGDFEAPYRARRIAEHLGAVERATPESMSALQLDDTSGVAVDLQDQLRTCGAKGPAADLYLGWSRRLTGQGAPVLHGAFRAALARRLREKTRLGLAGGGFFARAYPALNLLRVARENPWIADWIDDPATSWAEGPCEQLTAALDEAWQAVRHRAGADPATWRWERRHLLQLVSPFGVGPLARWFNPRAVGVPGDADAPNAMGHRAPADLGSGPYLVSHGPSYRLLAWWDAAGAVRSSSALPGGADEHPGAEHAFDRLADYAAGRATPLLPAESVAGAPLEFVP